MSIPSEELRARLAPLTRRVQELEALLTEPTVLQDGNRLQSLTREYRSLKAILDRLDAWATAFLRPTFPFTGFEIAEDYFAESCRRLTSELSQRTLIADV